MAEEEKYRTRIDKMPAGPRGVGRPKDYGFTTAEIVSAFIELNRRRNALVNPENALQSAKDLAAERFVTFEGQADPERAVDRYWSQGNREMLPLNDEELAEIIRPYELSQSPKQ